MTLLAPEAAPARPWSWWSAVDHQHPRRPACPASAAARTPAYRPVPGAVRHGPRNWQHPLAKSPGRAGIHHRVRVSSALQLQFSTSYRPPPRRGAHRAFSGIHHGPYDAITGKCRIRPRAGATGTTNSSSAHCGSPCVSGQLTRRERLCAVARSGPLPWRTGPTITAHDEHRAIGQVFQSLLGHVGRFGR